MSEKTGIATAIKALPPPAGGQKDMFCSNAAPLAERLAAPGRRGRGRPKGSRNKRAEGVLDALAATGVDAIKALGAIVAAGPIELARKWWISRDVAVRLYLEATKELASYQSAKRAAIRIEDNRGAVSLEIIHGSHAPPPPAGGNDGDRELYPAEGETIEAEAVAVGAMSHHFEERQSNPASDASVQRLAEPSHHATARSDEVQS